MSNCKPLFNIANWWLLVGSLVLGYFWGSASPLVGTQLCAPFSHNISLLHSGKTFRKQARYVLKCYPHCHAFTPLHVVSQQCQSFTWLLPLSNIPVQRPLLFIGTQWGSPAPGVLIPTPGTPWLFLSRPICNTIIPGFLTLEKIQSMSAFHTPCAELVLLKKLYRKGIKMTVYQLSKYQRHFLTLTFTLASLASWAPGASITMLFVWGAFLGSCLQPEEPKLCCTWALNSALQSWPPVLTIHSTAPFPLLFLMVRTCLPEAPLGSSSFSWPRFSSPSLPPVPS